MHFSFAYPAADGTDVRNALKLTPATLSELAAKAHDVPNASPDRDGLDFFNFADNLEMHAELYHDAGLISSCPTWTSPFPNRVRAPLWVPCTRLVGSLLSWECSGESDPLVKHGDGSVADRHHNIFLGFPEGDHH